jgi:protein involved in polysaccharide export with SLBB domain
MNKLAGVIFFIVMLCFTGVSTAEYESKIILRVGDILKLELHGEESFANDFQIDRQGHIELPEVGLIKVSGFDIDEAEQRARVALSAGFRDLHRFRLLLKERRLPITVLGYVKKPGPVDLPEQGNVQMALTDAGGLSTGAQLDKLQVRRGEEIFVFDYKQYLDSGDASKMPLLQPLDIVFVPASPLIGNVQVEFDAASLTAGGDASVEDKAIRVFGEVGNPGTFSYKKDASVVDMLMRSGGVTRFAGVERIRVINDGEPTLFNLKSYLDSGDDSHLVKITAGATIFVPKQEEEIKRGARMVYIMGEVFKPGAYEGSEGTTFLDILANAGGPTRYANGRLIRLLRQSGDVESFDLQAYTNGLGDAQPPQIRPGDAIFVPEKSNLNEKSWLQVTPERAVMVMGAVIRPGRYEWSDEMSLLDLLAHAGGPSSSADKSELRILSNEENIQPMLFNLESFLLHGGAKADLPKVRAGYTIVMAEMPDEHNDNKSSWLRHPAEKSMPRPIYIG